MGTWGVENFASDGARDYLALLATRLVATINEVYKDDERLALDEDGETMFMPSVDMLALMCERYNIQPPRPDTVRQWGKKYLAVYDASIDELDADDDYKVERRQVIDRTFHWLQSLADSYWE